MSDEFGLERFVTAQEGVYEQVCPELRAGRKTTHWMWFIFPQITGLGSSPMAVQFGISGLEEARAFLEHAALGPRLRECTGIVCGVEGKTVEEIFGSPDDLKFHSSMTLFAKAAEADEADEVFGKGLEKYFDEEMDMETLERI